MTQHIVFLILGLGSGAVFASLALGLVMTYRSSGVINFATGAIALFGAYTYSFLRQGELIVPIPWLAETVDIGNDTGLALGLLISVLLCAVLGMLLYGLVFRPLRQAPAVAKAVVSIGVMVLLQGLLAAKYGTTPIRVDKILPEGTFELGGVLVPRDRVWFAVVIMLVALALAAANRFTRFGLATRAVAETEKGAFVTGLRADRIAMANWALSGAVAGLGGVLIAPIVPLVPSAYTLFIVPALAAALAGRFERLAVAAGVAIAIGAVQSELNFLVTQHSWMPQHGLSDLVPLLVILGILVLHGRPLPQRGAVVTSALGRAPRPRAVIVPTVATFAAGLIGLSLLSGGYRAALITSFIMAVIALSQVVVTGYAGQVSLAQLTLAGAGAFLLSRLTEAAGVPFPWAPLLAALGAMVVGVVIGLPALRIRGLPVAVATLALAGGISAVWFNNPDWTGGVSGAGVESPEIFGIDLGIGGGSDYPRIAFGVLCLGVLVIAILGVATLRRSSLGAAMLAVRANERAAAANGINVARTKVIAFAIASFMAGLGGALLAYQQTLATASVYSAFAGLALFTIVYITGVTSISGGVLAGFLASGGLVYVLVVRELPGLGIWYEVITGCVLAIQVIQFPEGLTVYVSDLFARFRRRPRVDDDLTSLPAGHPVGAEVSLPAAVDLAAAPVALAVRGVSVTYGSVTAVEDVSFDVRAGSIVGVIGPNGAGKTTLMDAISGFVPCSGDVVLGDLRLTGRKPHVRAQHGLGRTFQSMELWEDLTVEENIAARLDTPSGARAEASPLDDPFAFLGLEHLKSRPVAELSQGQRQLVSIARALAGRPKVLVLDEPGGGLDSTESQWLADQLRRIRAAGLTIVLVDHDMGLVLGVCDQIHVLDLGVLIASGSPSEISSDQRVIEAYLGTTQTPAEAAS